MTRWLRVTRAITVRECRALFLTPIAWVFLSVIVLIAGVFFVLTLESSPDTTLRPLIGNLTLVLLFCLPAVTMRQISEEDRTGTLELLLTAPAPISALVCGKWLATMALCTAMIGMLTPFAAALSLYGSPGIGAFATLYLGLWLTCGLFVSAGLWASSLTRNAILAAMGAIFLTLPLWLASLPLDRLSAPWSALLRHLALVEHLKSFSMGQLDSADLIWFALTTAWFLFMTIQSIGSRAWR